MIDGAIVRSVLMSQLIVDKQLVSKLQLVAWLLMLACSWVSMSMHLIPVAAPHSRSRFASGRMVPRGVSPRVAQ